MSTSYHHQISELVEKLHLNHVKRELKEVFPTTVRSKKDYIEAVSEAAPYSSELQEKLLELKKVSLHLGSRQLEVFKVQDTPTKTKLTDFFDNVSLTTKKKLLKSYPFSLENKDELMKMKRSRLNVLESGNVLFSEKDCQFIILSSVAEKEVKSPGNQFLNTEGLEYIQENNASVVLYSTQKIQLFHVIYWHEATGEFVISVDRSKLSVTDSQDQLFMIRNMLAKEMLTVGNPLNVFGAIEPLYNESEGSIVKLGHVTTQSNPVRLTLRGSEKCLKRDRYHSSGESEGHVAGKFSVAKRWNLRDGDENNFFVEVELSGKPAMLDTSQPLTDFAVIKCMRLEDLDFAIQNVSPHSSQY